MAEITGLADDLDGTPQWIRPVTRHTFSLDGVDHVVDLHDEHAAQLRADFAKWIDASRAVREGKANGSVRTLSPATPDRKAAVTKKAKGKKGHRDPEQLKAERSWLRSQGHTVSHFGKIPDELHRLYEAHVDALGTRGGHAGSPFATEGLFSAV